MTITPRKKQPVLFHTLSAGITILIAFAVLLSGCSSPARQSAFLDFNNTNPYTQIYNQGETAIITTRDTRNRPEVIFFNSDSEPPLAIAAVPPLTDIITRGLAKGFSEQGLTLTRSEPKIHIKIEIRDLKAEVAWEKGLYKAQMHTGLQLIIDSIHTTLTKNYNRDAVKKSLTKPELQDLEIALREQLQEILSLILSDPEIESAIKKNT